jgi:hypothetical protein
MRPLFDGRSLWMYTFTYYHSKPPLEVWSEYSAAWNRFRTAAAKRYGRFAYARVLEHHHKSPYPHLHIIADKEFGAVWLAAELKSAGFGYQAKCKPITSEGAITYVTKYLTKVSAAVLSVAAVLAATGKLSPEIVSVIMSIIRVILTALGVTDLS